MTKPFAFTVTLEYVPAVTPEAFNVNGIVAVPDQSRVPVPVASPDAVRVWLETTKLNTFEVEL
ncbi:hypothetical protein D3C80_2011710 [compost metagenome]